MMDDNLKTTHFLVSEPKRLFLGITNFQKGTRACENRVILMDFFQNSELLILTEISFVLLVMSMVSIYDPNENKCSDINAN